MPLGAWLLAALALSAAAPPHPPRPDPTRPAACPQDMPRPAAPRAETSRTFPPPPPERQADALDEALARIGRSRADLGFRPKGDWVRFPHPERIRFLLPCFQTLYAEPLRVVSFTGSLSAAVQRYLQPDRIARDQPVLYPLLLNLGVEKMVTGFRGFGVPPEEERDEADPLFGAVGGLLALGVSGPGWDELRAAADAVPIELQRPLARLVDAAVEAQRWRERALRRLPPETLRGVVALRDLDQTISDALSFPEALDDAAFYLDAESLHYAGQILAQAAQDALHGFTEALAAQPDLDGRFSFPTAFGEVILGGRGDDRHVPERPFVLVDLGGDDTYTGPVGGTADARTGVSVALDLSGNDHYVAGEDVVAAQGGAVLGAAVLLDAAGDDRYEAVRLAQGAGLLGLGLLFDGGGDDQYRLQVSGQGAGYLGVGLLAEMEGSDSYYLFGDGQGFGTLGGVGVLADGAGDDHYTAEADAAVAGRGDYHSGHRIAANNAQGMGGGRRGDISDGHAWAGGLGALLDASGDDVYEAGNWSMGTAYWFGVGILWDGAGDDRYRSVYFTQGSGAHFCISALIDDAGDDLHETYDTAGAALGFGWDLAVALVLDRGGNDVWRSKILSLGCAQISSNALFLELGGDDVYVLGRDALGLGAADWRANDATRDPLAPYFFEAPNLGLFLDLGGDDSYRTLEDEALPWEPAGNDQAWPRHEPGSEGWRAKSWALGVDRADGMLDLDR